MPELSPAARAVRERLYTDFEFYAKNALWIRTKDQKVVQFRLNKAQKLLLNEVMDQLDERGFVRLIILKGRQMGSSTFVEAFLYWWVSQRKAQRALVVAQDVPASATIFGMTKRFHDKCPEILRPSTRYSSRKELASMCTTSDSWLWVVQLAIEKSTWRLPQRPVCARVLGWRE